MLDSKENQVEKNTETELRELLDRAADMIANMYENPSSWGTWIIHLFKRLEARGSESYPQKSAWKQTLGSLANSIKTRLDTGGW